MPLPDPQPGVVIRYNYLWRREADAGRQEAVKARSCAIVMSVERSDRRTIVTVVPITHARPDEKTGAIELPPAVKRSLGLDDDASWIVTQEVNTFEWPGPDLEPIRPGSGPMIYGRLPRPITTAVIRTVLAHVRSGRLRLTRRTE